MSWLERVRRALLGLDRTVASAVLTVGALSMVAKLGVTAKELLIARRFGTGDDIDAFLVAYAIPLFASTVVCGSFNSALIPTLVQTRERDGRAAAQRLFSSILVFTVCLLVAVVAVIALGSSLLLPMVGSSFAGEKLDLARQLFWLMLPLLVISGVGTIWSAVMNSEGKFATPALVPIISPILVGTATILTRSTFAIHAVALATVAGASVETFFLAVGVRRLGFSLAPRWGGLDEPVRQVLRQYAPMVAGATVLSGSGLVSQALAGTLGPGSVAALNYGSKVSSFVSGIAALSLGSAILPKFSVLASRSEVNSLRRMLKSYGVLVLATIAPLTLGLIAASLPIIQVFFQRGAFTHTDSIHVARIQTYFLLQLPFYVLGTLFVRMISAFQGNSILMRISIAALAVQVTLGYFLSKVLGVAGIAAATSAMYLFSAICAGIACWRLLRECERGSSPNATGASA